MRSSGGHPDLGIGGGGDGDHDDADCDCTEHQVEIPTTPEAARLPAPGRSRQQQGARAASQSTGGQAPSRERPARGEEHRQGERDQ